MDATDDDRRPTGGVLLPDVVAAVVAHMNADHADDCLSICRAAVAPDLTSARLASLDEDGLVFEVHGGAGPTTARVPWRRPIRERADIRSQVREITLDARAASDRGRTRPGGGPGGHAAALVLLALVALLGVRIPKAVAQEVDPTVAPATTTSPDGLSTTDGTRTLSVSQASGLDPAGQTVTITGSGYDVAKGVYVALCAVPAPHQPPTPCGGGADTTGGSGASSWISSDPPSYASGLTQPYGPGGTFTLGLTLSPVLSGGVDCRASRCAVVSRNDHTRSTDRSQDIFVPVAFRADAPAVAPPPTVPPTAPPTTPVPTTVPAPTTTSTTTSTTLVAPDESTPSDSEGDPPRDVPASEASATDALDGDEVVSISPAAGETSGGSNGVAIAAAATGVATTVAGGIVLARRRRPTLDAS